MNKQHGGRQPDSKNLESIIDDLARQFRVPPETIRPLLLCAYQELMTEAVVKDFVSIFAMRMVRDRFETRGDGRELHRLPDAGLRQDRRFAGEFRQKDRSARISPRRKAPDR